MQTDERFLVAFAQSGDETAFEQLAGPYYKRLRYWLQKQLPALKNDAPFADAIEAMAFEDARNGIKTFKGESSFSTWLHTIAKNRACQELARRGRDVPIDKRDFEAVALRTERSAADILDKKAYRHDPDRHHRDDPIRQLMGKQNRALRKYAVRYLLTAAERQVWHCRFRGMKYPEIQRELGITYEAARRRWSDAFSKISRYVESHESPRQLSNVFIGGPKS